MTEFDRIRKELTELRDLFDAVLKQPDEELKYWSTPAERVKQAIAEIIPWAIGVRIPEAPAPSQD